MSGLFATLVSAALGQIPVAEPRPRARFEEDFSAPWGIEWREDAAGERPAAALKANPSATVAPPRSGDVSASRPVNARVPPPLLSVPEWPPAAQPRVERAGAEAIPVGQSQAGREPGAQRPPKSVQAERTEQLERPAPLAAALQPLLPMSAPSPAGAVTFTPGNITATPNTAASEATAPDPAFVLKVGRIEVRPPAVPPAPKVRARQVAQTRSVALARAPVRQSLDDYRARWGR